MSSRRSRKNSPSLTAQPAAAPGSTLEVEFLALISAARRAGADSETNAKLSERYGISLEDAGQPRLLRDRLLREAASQLPATVGGVDLRVLARHLHLRQAADGLDAKLASELVALLRDATRQTTDWILPPFQGHTEAWEAALFALLCLERRSHHRSDSQDARMNGVAESIKALRALGYPIAIKNARVEFPKWEDAFLTRLDGSVCELGGALVAEEIFRKLRPKLSKSQGYFHITRAASTVPMDVPRPGLPNGFLLNLAAKHISTFATIDQPEGKVAQLFAEADHYGRVHDLAPSNVWEIHNRSLSSIIPFLRELAAFDTLYQVPQFRLSDAARAVTHLFDWAPGDVLQSQFRVGTQELAAIMQCIDAKIQDEVGPATFTPRDFATVLPDERARDVLMAFSHQGPCNVGFNSPLQTEHLDAWTRPLFAGDGEFTILDARVAGNAFVECAASLLRDVDRGTDQKMGGALERWVQAELRKKNIAVHSGCYRASTGDGECDIVIETGSRIILLELKRKSLTRRSRSADAWALLRDLQHALLEPQKQLGGHELALWRDGQLRLEDGTTVVRGDRDIERVALTLFDYGAFHTRDVSMQLLDLVAGAVVSSPDSDQKDVAKLNALLGVLGKQAQELMELKSTERPHFGCWFLGVPQFLVLLEHVDGPESFWTELKRTRHMSIGRLSWFAEHEYARSLPELAKHADAVSTKATIVLGG